MGGGAKVGTQSISKRWLVRHPAVLWQPAGALCHRPRQVLGHEKVEVNIAARNQQDHLSLYTKDLRKAFERATLCWECMRASPNKGHCHEKQSLPVELAKIAFDREI